MVAERFLYDMLRDPGFLLAVGVRLIPRPLTDAAIQVNYYSPSTDKLGSEEVSKWHYDGTDYVFTLAAPVSIERGQCTIAVTLHNTGLYRVLPVCSSKKS